MVEHELLLFGEAGIGGKGFAAKERGGLGENPWSG